MKMCAALQLKNSWHLSLSGLKSSPAILESVGLEPWAQPRRPERQIQVDAHNLAENCFKSAIICSNPRLVLDEVGKGCQAVPCCHCWSLSWSDKRLKKPAQSETHGPAIWKNVDWFLSKSPKVEAMICNYLYILICIYTWIFIGYKFPSRADLVWFPPFSRVFPPFYWDFPPRKIDIFFRQIE